MTKPDSTDAGGVTHDDVLKAAFSLAGGWGCDEAGIIRTYVQQQEAALATLTRERDSLRERLDSANAICRARLVALEKLRDTGQVPLTCHDCGELTFVGHECQPATPPAPLPDNPPGHVDAQIEWLESVAAKKKAPLPGGQGPTEACLNYAENALKNSSSASRDGAPDTAFRELRIAVRHILQHLKEQGGEGREG